jgi:hypothetical protein
MQYAAANTPRTTSTAVFGDASLPDEYTAAGRLPDCADLAAISRENPHMPIPQLLGAFDAHRADCACCARIAREDALLETEPREPACTCKQTGADLFDARGCEIHDSESRRNVRLRAITMNEKYEALEREAA